MYYNGLNIIVLIGVIGVVLFVDCDCIKVNVFVEFVVVFGDWIVYDVLFFNCVLEFVVNDFLFGLFFNIWCYFGVKKFVGIVGKYLVFICGLVWICCY